MRTARSGLREKTSPTGWKTEKNRPVSKNRIKKQNA